MLCVATVNPDSAPETYVRQHIRLIAPDRTVVVYFEGAGKSVSGLPSMRIPTGAASLRFWQRLANLARFGYPGALTGLAGTRTAEFMRAHGVTAVLAEFGPTGCAFLPLRRASGIKLVVNFHGYDATVMPKRRMIRRAYQYLNREADAFICGSEHFKGVLVDLGFDPGKVHVVPCGIETGRFISGRPADPNLVLAVGRFVEKKAPHLTLQAFAKACRNAPEARLEMIGDGPLLSGCKQLAADLGITDKVTFHGAQPHAFVQEKMSQAWVFVQHSVVASNGDTESQGISLLEAMACGVPVVATRHNGFVESVLEGETGFLVAEGNVDAMAARIGAVLADPQLRSRLGRAGRQRVVDCFEAEAQAERLRGLLAV